MTTLSTGMMRGLLLATSLMLSPEAALAQYQKLLPEPPAGYASHGFGEAIAANERELAVSAPAGDGYVSIYRRSGGQWRLTQHLVSTDTDSYGYRLAMGDSWLAVANRNTEVTGWPNYIDVYRRAADGWVFDQRLDSPAPGSAGYIHHLAVSENSLLVGLVRMSGEGDITHRQLYDFRRENGSWVSPHALLPPYSSTQFGKALAASSRWLVTSDPLARPGAAYGAVSVFAPVGDEWTHLSLITSSVGQGAWFGNAVALCGQRLAVSTVAITASSVPVGWGGRVDIFEGDPSQWSSNRPAPAVLTQADRWFGRSLACSASTMVIGGDTFRTFYSAPLSEPRVVRTHVLSDPEAYGNGLTFAVVGGDVIVGDQLGPVVEGVPRGTGAVYIFAGVGESIFAHGFE